MVNSEVYGILPIERNRHSNLLQTGALNPTQVQINGVKHVIRYLTGTVSDGLTFAKGLETEALVELFGMCDGSYICGDDSKGQGYHLIHISY